MLEKQELHCHNCNNYVQFDIDVELNGNHVLSCPNCGHEHCRVVEDGIITSERWDSRNPNTYTVSSYNITWSSVSTYNTYISNSALNQDNVTDGRVFLYQSWNNTGFNGTNSQISYQWNVTG